MVRDDQYGAARDVGVELIRVGAGARSRHTASGQARDGILAPFIDVRYDNTRVHRAIDTPVTTGIVPIDPVLFLCNIRPIGLNHHVIFPGMTVRDSVIWYGRLTGIGTGSTLICRNENVTANRGAGLIRNS